MYARPKPSDDEDTILKLQEEFLRDKTSKSAATVINKRKVTTNAEDARPTVCSGDSLSANSKRPKSKFALEREKLSLPKNKPNIADVSVLGEITEKSFSNEFVIPPSLRSSEGFPKVFRRDDTKVEAKGGSIFLQQVRAKGGIFTQEIDENILTKPVHAMSLQRELGTLVGEAGTEVFGARSYVVDGAEGAALHAENVARLAALTRDEIENERRRLLAEMDPAVVEFLRARRGANPVSVDESSAGVSGVNVASTSGVPQTVSAGTVAKAVSFAGSVARETSRLPEVDPRMEVDVETPSTPSVQLPFSPEEMDAYVHMNVVEEDKLLWTTDLPPPPPSLKDSFAARFDFKGLLLPYVDPEVHATRGLHHHGEEPERPGYTLQELLLLGRSTVIQQRVLSLVTLANILSKTKLGYYDECFEPPLLDQMLDADLFLFIRFSLDEASGSVVAAAVFALRHLLCCVWDEVCLDRLLGQHNSLQQPSLLVEDSDNEQEAELKDHELLKVDVVRGALRTDLVPRLRYILDKLSPDVNTVKAVLDILLRICRHSFAATQAVAQCGDMLRLVSSIVEPQDVGPPVPSSRAVKLLRVVSSRSRRLATDVACRLDVMDAVVVPFVTITLDTGPGVLRSKEQLLLNVECFHLWQTFLSYGLATQHFTRLLPALHQLLRHHLNHTSVPAPSTYDVEHAASLLSLLGTALGTAESQGREVARQRAAGEDRLADMIQVAEMRGFVQVVAECAGKWLAQAAVIPPDKLSFGDMKLLSAVLHCLSLFVQVFSKQTESDVVSLLDMIERIDREQLCPLLAPSGTFSQKMILNMRCCSNLTCGSTKRRDPTALPSLGAVGWGGQLQPVLEQDCPLMLMTAVVRYLRVTHLIHRGLGNESVHLLLSNEGLTGAITALIATPQPALTSNWFTRCETRFYAQLLKLVRLSNRFEPIFYDLALKLVALLQAGDELLLRDVLHDVVFEPMFLGDVTTSCVSDVDIGALRSVVDNLSGISDCYATLLGLSSLPPPSPLTVTSLTLPSSHPALPSDWVYLPLVQLYSDQVSSESASKEQIRVVTLCLGWAMTMECRQGKEKNRGMSAVARFCRVATVFLASCDLFLDPMIRSYLQQILKQLLKQPLDFSAKIPGLASFYDFYTQMLEQFAAVSYGDETFCQYVLVPLQQRHDVAFRRQVWSEHAAVLRVLGVPPGRLAFDVAALYEPPETDVRLLTIYLQSLAKGLVTERWCPVLYHAATRHVASFIRGPHDDPQRVELQRTLREGVAKLGNQELKTRMEQLVRRGEEMECGEGAGTSWVNT